MMKLWMEKCGAVTARAFVLALIVLAGWNTVLRAQTATPVWSTSAIRFDCSDVYGTGFRVLRSIPSPIVVGQPYTLLVPIGEPIAQHFFAVVGNELQLHLRRSSSPNPVPDRQCYRFTDAPILNSIQIQTLSTFTYEALTSTTWSNNANPAGTRPLPVDLASTPIPVVGGVALIVLAIAIVMLGRRAFKIAQ
jgi:hypothetical protein